MPRSSRTIHRAYTLKETAHAKPRLQHCLHERERGSTPRSPTVKAEWCSSPSLPPAHREHTFSPTRFLFRACAHLCFREWFDDGSGEDLTGSGTCPAQRCDRTHCPPPSPCMRALHPLSRRRRSPADPAGCTLTHMVTRAGRGSILIVRNVFVKT